MAFNSQMYNYGANGGSFPYNQYTDNHMYQPPVQMEEFAHTSYNTPGQPQNLPHLPMTQDQFTPVYKPPESVRQYHGPQPLGISFALGDQLLDAQNQPLTHFEQPFADQEQLPKQANQEQPPPNQTNQAVQVVPGQTSSTRRSSTSSSTCTTEKVLCSIPSPQLDYLPSRDVIPGVYGFKVSFKNPQTAAYTYTDDTKVLCINKQVDVAAMFSFKVRPPSNLLIRALVCCKNDEDILKLGAVKRCPTHIDKDKGSDHFLICNNPRALYGDHQSHKIVSIPLNAMAECDSCLMCVFSLACYSTCFVGKGANKPTLVIVFSLIDISGKEMVVVGQDVVNLRSCACPNRDSNKMTKKGKTAVASGRVTKKRQKARTPTPAVASTSPACALPLPSRLNLVKDAQPDEEGYYTFTLKTRDVSFYNLLTVLKEGFARGNQDT